MLWAVVIAAATGVVLGLWLRVPAVTAASIGIVLACSILARLVNVSVLATAVYILCALTALQAGYLAGLVVYEARSRRDRDRGC